MGTYYRERAEQYDSLYSAPERQRDLASLKRWVAHHTVRRSVLEIAAGTGFWTQAAAARATAITATDLNTATLTIAAKRRLGPHVTLLEADAYALPKFACRFETGMAHLWWSHVDLQRARRFLLHFASRLQPGGELLMIDQLYLEGYSTPAFRRDRAGNRYELRTLENGHVFQIVKNYPTRAELQAIVGDVCKEVRITCLTYFWALRARVRG